jgi:hypothetical protein
MKNLLIRVIKRRIQNSYLFVLCPPYAGSTLLNELLSTSSNVSTNNDIGSREGQQLPTTRKIMYDHKERWNIDMKYDWPIIKKEWQKYWNVRRPILLEKSPPNLIRAKEIQDHFKPAYFICMVRNPYANCEGIIRRHNYQPKDAANFVIKCLKYQKENIENLEKALMIKYEELTENTRLIADKFTTFLPCLNDINTYFLSRAHNYMKKPMPIINMNDEKISRLKSQQIHELNSVFEKEKEFLDYFGYEIICENQTLPQEVVLAE